MTSKVRVRFAPSPTGALHIGGLRTALYNFLFARKHQGTFVLRIEDTDQSRLVTGAEDYILKALHWLDIAPDEGPEQGGPYAPYRQSERADIYRQYAMQLMEEGKAYYAFDTPEELDAMRQRLKEAKVAFQQYNSITRTSMRNSLTMSPGEVEELMAQEVPYVVRLKIPPKEDIRFQDRIRGWVKVHSSTIDDKVILKSGGLPTYHLANVVDDHLMEITHVIRGEEWLPSAPLHVLLYRFLGWEHEMPEFAHLPLILKPDGNGKLSKRDADKQGFPIFPLTWKDPQTREMSEGFKEKGYLPAALVNFLAMLGWNPGNEEELFSVKELIEAFSLDRIVKSGAKFDISKAQWFNQQYIRELPVSELENHLREKLKDHGHDANDEKLKAVVNLLAERITFADDLWQQGKILFEAPAQYDMALAQKKWNPEAAEFLQNYQKALDTLKVFDSDHLHQLLKEQLEAVSWGFGKVMPSLRLALTGEGRGPDLMKIMEILGKDETGDRISWAVEKLAHIN